MTLHLSRPVVLLLDQDKMRLYAIYQLQQTLYMSRPVSLLDARVYPAPTDTLYVAPSVPPRPRQYESIRDIPASTHTTSVSPSLPPRSSQYDTIGNTPATIDITPASTSLPTEDDQYETIHDMAVILTPPQDIEHPNDQQDLEGNHSSIGNPTSSGH